MNVEQLPMVPVCRLLPDDAVNLLRRAAATDPRLPAGLSKKRTVALEQATQTVKLKYPKYFL